MTAFRVVSLATVMALIALLGYRRFQASVLLGKQPFLSTFRAYLFWAARTTASLFKKGGWGKTRSFFHVWLGSYPESWQKLALSGAWLSFFYLAASGLGLAIFCPRGLYGIPLLLHVLGGGVFILCLTLLVILRAKDYLPLLPEQKQLERRRSFWRSFPASLPRPILFWLLVISGFSLALTALLSMLPYFAFEAQLDLIAIHRYSGLIALLTAILFLDQALPRPGS